MSAPNDAHTPVELSAPVTQWDHVRGPRDAPIVVVEYGDYECPHCGRAYWVVKELLEQLGGEIAFVFRNFPIAEAHPRAEAVAEALEAAGGQGRFWEMHDRFYERQHQLESLDLEEHARAVGLDVDLWREALQERAYRDRIHEDVRSGQRSGVTATPTFFINGNRYRGDHDFDSMLAAIRRVIEQSRLEVQERADASHRSAGHPRHRRDGRTRPSARTRPRRARGHRSLARA